MRNELRFFKGAMWATPPSLLLWAAIVAAACSALGCSATSQMSMGPLNGRPLIELVVSSDMSVVAKHCAGVPSNGRPLGCHRWQRVDTPVGVVEYVKVVRYADDVPSDVSMEIDAHELCHLVAEAQGLTRGAGDPCHVGNGGVIESAARRW